MTERTNEAALWPTAHQAIMAGQSPAIPGPALKSEKDGVPHYDYSVTAWMGNDGLGFFYTCPKCHFYKNSEAGPCRRVGCDGTVELVEVRVISTDADLTLSPASPTQPAANQEPGA